MSGSKPVLENLPRSIGYCMIRWDVKNYWMLHEQSIVFKRNVIKEKRKNSDICGEENKSILVVEIYEKDSSEMDTFSKYPLWIF